MSESVIFNSPLIVVCYGIALALSLIGLIYKDMGRVLAVVSAIAVVGTTVYALLLGAALSEAAIIIIIFLLIELAGVKGDNK